MSRDFYINGESMVTVKGNPILGLGTLVQLGLTADPITVTHNFKHRDMNVDAYGGPEGIPPDVQWMLGEVYVQMTLIHFDPAVLALCHQAAMGGALAEGSVARAGTRLGANGPRFGGGNVYIGLNIASPVVARPWRFWYSYIVGAPAQWPLGTEKSIVQLTWRCIPYTQDPWGGSASQPNTVAGGGAGGAIIYDRTADT